MTYKTPKSVRHDEIGLAKRKRLERDITKEFEAWAIEVKSSRNNLLSVPLQKKGEPAIACKYLQAKFKCDYSVCSSRTEILNSVIDAMIKEKIIITGHNSSSNEWRRKLLAWYESLSDNEKQSIPIIANTISAHRYLKHIPGMENLKWARSNLPLVEKTFNEIITDLEKRGVINSNYKTTAER